MKKRSKNTKLKDLLVMESVSLVTKRGRLRWFEHEAHKDNGDWIK